MISIQPGAVGIEVVGLGGGIDVGNHVTLFHFLPQLDIQFFDLPRRLRAHIHHLCGGNLAGGVYGLLDIAAFHRIGEVIHLLGRLENPP